MKSRRLSVHKKQRKHNKTYKNRNMEQFKKEIVIKFLVLLNTIKLYHWKTHSYATHKATDDLYDKLNGHIDTFIEVLLGKTGDRVNLFNVKSIPLKSFLISSELKKELEDFKEYLVGLDKSSVLVNQGMSNTDLFNIRDEIMADVNQFLYLLTFL